MDLYLAGQLLDIQHLIHIVQSFENEYGDVVSDQENVSGPSVYDWYFGKKLVFLEQLLRRGLTTVMFKDYKGAKLDGLELVIQGELIQVRWEPVMKANLLFTETELKDIPRLWFRGYTHSKEVERKVKISKAVEQIKRMVDELGKVITKMVLLNDSKLVILERVGKYLDMKDMDMYNKAPSAKKDALLWLWSGGGKDILETQIEILEDRKAKLEFLKDKFVQFSILMTKPKEELDFVAEFIKQTNRAYTELIDACQDPNWETIMARTRPEMIGVPLRDRVFILEARSTSLMKIIKDLAIATLIGMGIVYNTAHPERKGASSTNNPDLSIGPVSQNLDRALSEYFEQVDSSNTKAIEVSELQKQNIVNNFEVSTPTSWINALKAQNIQDTDYEKDISESRPSTTFKALEDVAPAKLSSASKSLEVLSKPTDNFMFSSVDPFLRSFVYDYLVGDPVILKESVTNAVFGILLRESERPALIESLSILASNTGIERLNQHLGVLHGALTVYLLKTDGLVTNEVHTWLKSDYYKRVVFAEATTSFLVWQTMFRQVHPNDQKVLLGYQYDIDDVSRFRLPPFKGPIEEQMNHIVEVLGLNPDKLSNEQKVMALYKKVINADILNESEFALLEIASVLTKQPEPSLVDAAADVLKSCFGFVTDAFLALQSLLDSKLDPTIGDSLVNRALIRTGAVFILAVHFYYQGGLGVITTELRDAISEFKNWIVTLPRDLAQSAQARFEAMRNRVVLSIRASLSTLPNLPKLPTTNDIYNVIVNISNTAIGIASKVSETVTSLVPTASPSSRPSTPPVVAPPPVLFVPKRQALDEKTQWFYFLSLVEGDGNQDFGLQMVNYKKETTGVIEAMKKLQQETGNVVKDMEDHDRTVQLFHKMVRDINKNLNVRLLSSIQHSMTSLFFKKELHLRLLS